MIKRIFLLLLVLSQTVYGQQKTSYKFSFGTKEIPDYIKVNSSSSYSEEQGYGFDFGTIPTLVDRGGKPSLTSGFATSKNPFFFSVNVPEGNYNVKIITGDPKEPTRTTIRVESRRLLFEKIITAPGKFATLTATVNIRVPEIAGTDLKVIKKPRELYKLDWDNKMTFEFNDVRPCICALELTKTDDAVTVYLAGNSTVVDQDDDPWASWGQMIPRFFRQGIAVANNAESGLSLGSFISGNRLKKVLSTMKKGDYLFIEFGHNDMKEKGPDDGAYKSFSERLRLFVTETRKSGGIPVIVSPANRRTFDDNGKITNSLEDYPAAARSVANELSVPFIDLNGMTKILYEAMGPENSKKAFVIYPANSFPGEPNALNDNTHFNSYGAYELAKCIIEGIKGNNLGIKKYLIKGMPAFNPAHPDPADLFSLPLSPHSPVVIEAQQLSWPAITKETKPWARWWWPGSIVAQSDLTAALEKYHAAGLGGLELTVIYGVKGEESRFIPYLSPEWMKMFEFTLNEAKRNGIGIDLANSSSWPFGGTWVKEKDASKFVDYKTYSLKAGESLKEKIVKIQEPWVKWNGTFRTDIKNITDPINENRNLQELAIDQIKFQKQIPLQVLMAYSDNGEIIDITNKVDDEGNLNWVAPAGNWTLYAAFEGLHGKMVERAGPGGEGLVIDHFSDEAISDYLNHFDEAFKGYDLKYLRGYFNDSYEVDDAKGQSDWTPDFFNQFKIMRGYDLKENLTALFQKDNPEKNARVLCDYRQTISDLILDKFTKDWTAWANKQGKITRNQSHGSPGNILDLYAASDIPETEGTDIFRMKFATSAANVSGKKYASAEAATWLGEHFSSTLLDVKKAVDQYFIAGVNHMFYHGTCFSPVNEPWPGFLFYAAVEFTPVNSFWNDFPILNSYIARVQSFLQNSKPDNDVLLWFPVYDRYSDYNNLMLEHFDAISPRFNGSKFKSAAELMNNKGYSFDYISDLQINSLLTYNNLLNTGRVSYQTLIIPECKYIPVETLNQIVSLAKKGATIIFFGEIPGDVPGWHNLEDRRKDFNTLKDQIKFSDSVSPEIQEAIIGNGRILKGQNLEKLLSYANIRRESLADEGLKFSRRKMADDNIYFILNQSDKEFNGWVELGTQGNSVAVFNPMNSLKGIGKSRRASNGSLEVYVRISPMQSIIVRLMASQVGGENYNDYDAAGNPTRLTGTWKVKFTTGGPVLPPVKEVTELTSWTNFGDDAYKNFSGTAEYTIDFVKPSGNYENWLMNIGKVCESARIFLNDKEIASLIGPDFQVVINNAMLKQYNTLTIRVSNLMANRISYLDRNNVDWKHFYNNNFPARLRQNSKNGIFDASAWEPRESGLIGPVTICAVKTVN